MKAKYIRVSTDEQSTARQEIFEGKLYIDKVSGVIPFSERNEGSKLLNDIRSGKVTYLHIHSIDRLGRNAIDIQTTINDIISCGCNIKVDDYGLEALLPTGEVNMMFKMITDLLATLSQMDRDNIKKRQKEGIAIAKAKGVYSKPRTRRSYTNEEVLERNRPIVKMLQAKMSLNEIVSATQKSKHTVIKVKKILSTQ